MPSALVSDPEDENIHLYNPMESPTVDITDDVRDALALAIPMKHLCKPDCKGLCPNCGHDLNKEECICLPAEIDNEWSALKELSERLRAEEMKRSKR